MNKSKLRLIRSSSNVEPSRKPKKFTRDENLMPSANYVYPSPLGKIPETDYPILPRAKSANSLLPINGHVSLKIRNFFAKFFWRKFHVQLEYQIVISKNLFQEPEIFRPENSPRPVWTKVAYPRKDRVSFQDELNQKLRQVFKLTR